MPHFPPNSCPVLQFRFISVLASVLFFLLIYHPKLILSTSPHDEGCKPDEDPDCITQRTTPKYDPQCKQLCDENRAKNHLEKYVFNCSKEYPNDDSEKQNCAEICDKCPKTICDSTNDPYVFHCPPMELDERCKERCNNKRASDGSAFDLNCHNEYDNENDRKQCSMECTKNCPIICDKKDNNEVLHCPSGKPRPSLTETSWFITTLIIIIPAMILLMVLIWKCIYSARRAPVIEPDSNERLPSYQEQLTRDPFLYITPNGEEDAMVALHEKEAKSAVAISSMNSNQNEIADAGDTVDVKAPTKK